VTEPEPEDPDDVLLAAHAHDAGDSRWWFSSQRVTYDRATALSIVNAGLALGGVVTDEVTPARFAALTLWVAAVGQTAASG